MKKNVIVAIALINLVSLCACKNSSEEYKVESNLSVNQVSGIELNENKEIVARKVPKEFDIWQIKPCDERFIYILTGDESSYIYDYENDTYKLVLVDENIDHINILNVLKESNRIYLDVRYKDEKSSLIGIDYINAIVSFKIECTVGDSNIIVSEDEQRITYRKDTSSLYVSNIDGSNEKLLLESIYNGEHPETTGYIPAKFIDNKILYTCIGWENIKGCGIIEIDTGKNVYYENGYQAGCYYDEKENSIYTTLYDMPDDYHGGIFKINMDTGDEETIIPIPVEEELYKMISFSEGSNQLVALGKENGNIDIYNLETREVIKNICLEKSIMKSIHLVGDYIYIRYSKNEESNFYDTENYIVREKI